VEAPIEQLMRWVFPRHLERDSSILSRGIKTATGEKTGVDVLLPSEIPAMIAMKYKRRVYKPLGIKLIRLPLSPPIDREGKFIALSEVSWQLFSLSTGTIGRDMQGRLFASVNFTLYALCAETYGSVIMRILRILRKAGAKPLEVTSSPQRREGDPHRRHWPPKQNPPRCGRD
jgi:hypothetical protein